MNNNDKYFFPLNYKFSSKFLGIIEYKILLPIVILLSIIIAILYIFKVDFFISFGIILFVSVPSICYCQLALMGNPQSHT